MTVLYYIFGPFRPETIYFQYNPLYTNELLINNISPVCGFNLIETGAF